MTSTTTNDVQTLRNEFKRLHQESGSEFLTQFWHRVPTETRVAAFVTSSEELELETLPNSTFQVFVFFFFFSFFR